MVDIVDQRTRSRMMAGVRVAHSTPELRVRSLLFGCGFRFRLHRADLPGKPDIVLASRKVAVFVHGCFWHMHAACRYFRLPRTRQDFWRVKLELNQARDEMAVSKLLEDGWRVLVIWECATRARAVEHHLRDELSKFVTGTRLYAELGIFATVTGAPRLRARFRYSAQQLGDRNRKLPR